MATTRSLNTSCLATNGDVMRYFFHIFKNQNETTNDAVKRTIESVTEIWLKSGIHMRKVLAVAFKTTSENFWIMEKLMKSKKRDNNSEKKNNGNRFHESWETLFNLDAKNAEQQLSGDRLSTEKARKEDVAFSLDLRNARKMQMSTLDNESRKKGHRKRQRVQTENLKTNTSFI